MAKRKKSADPGMGSYPGSVQQPPGAPEAFPGGSWSPNPAVKPGGMRPPQQRGVADYGTYATSNTGQSVGSEQVQLAGNQPVAPSGGASPIGGGPAYRRQQQYPENAGSRLTVSPSMKTMDPTGFAAPTMQNARIVPNGPRGRSAATFWQGALSDTTGVAGPS